MAAAPSHSKVFKKTRVTLIRELPDPAAMLDSPELRDSFSGYEKSQVLSPPTLCGRAEKLVDVLELSSDAALFRNFVAVLRRLKPKLATDLEHALVEVEAASDRGSSDAGAAVNANKPPPLDNRQPQAQAAAQLLGRVEEDAGPYGLNGYNVASDSHRISYLSYDCREYLGSELNGNAPRREAFRAFCHALGAEQRLAEAASRSGNPTGYFLQKFASQRPEATLRDLERALGEIDRADVFEGLLAKMGSEGVGPEDF